jgi:hypothetical protein
MGEGWGGGTGREAGGRGGRAAWGEGGSPDQITRNNRVWR